MKQQQTAAVSLRNLRRLPENYTCARTFSVNIHIARVKISPRTNDYLNSLLTNDLSPRCKTNRLDNHLMLRKLDVQMIEAGNFSKICFPRL